MGYRIVYGPDRLIQNTEKVSTFRLRMMTACFFLLGCLLTRCLWPEGTRALQQLLLPGEPTVTEQAFSQLISQLRGGESMAYAVEAFCKYVISHGTAH